MTWVKSSRSSGTSDCVELAKYQNGVAVRDSKNPDGPVLAFGSKSWMRFLAGVTGELGSR